MIRLFGRADPTIPTASQLTEHVTRSLGGAQNPAEATAKGFLEPTLGRVGNALHKRQGTFSRDGDQFRAEVTHWAGYKLRELYDENEERFKEAPDYREAVTAHLQTCLEEALVNDETGYDRVSVSLEFKDTSSEYDLVGSSKLLIRVEVGWTERA